MSWFNVWTGIKNKTCRYLLERYLGQFLEGSINLQQLKVDLYDGKATIKNVSLNVNAFNKLFEEQGWSVEIISGHIGLLTVTVPWNALMSNNSYIEVADAFILVRPVQRQNTGTSMLESMWSSASSSMQLAEECMKQKDDDYDDNTEIDTKSFTGLEKFAETIDNILNRIKATFINTTLCLEYQSADRSKAISLCIDINKLLYENETGCERLSKDATQQQQYSDYSRTTMPGAQSEHDENVYLLPMFAKHNISISGLRIYTEEMKVCEEHNDINNTNNTGATIPILEINEHLNIRIKMKQAESINGPKVVIDTEMGAIYMLLTPRQIHLLIKVMDAFQDEGYDKHEVEVESYSGAHSEHGMYQRRDDVIELGNWIDCEAVPPNSREKSLPHLRAERLRDLPRGGYSPPSSSISSSTTLTGFSRWQRKTTSFDYTGEILNFSLKICSFMAVVLMEDILVESSSNGQSPLNKSSEEDMISFAEKFFENTQQIVDNQVDSTKLTEGKNHIFIRIAPIVSEGSQHRVKHMILSKVNLIAQRLELFEVLSCKTTELITFERADGLNAADVSINIKSDPNTKTIDVLIQKCQIEVDISIYDRLSAIWGSSPFVTFSTPLHTPCYYFKQEVATPKSAVTTNLTAQSLELKLRFPIFDSRPIHDPNRAPWWQQNIRDDYLLITFDYLSMKISAGVFELLTNELNVHYVEQDLAAKIWLLKTSTSKLNILDYVKFVITIPDDNYWTKLKRSCSDALLYGGTSSSYKTKAQTNDRLPFSAKYVCRESDTLHNKHDTTESETVLLPGETAELQEFCSNTMRTSKIQVQIHVPYVEIMLESKQFYEIIYNRFNTDLFMWEPSSPILSTNNGQNTENKQSIRNITTATAAHRLRNLSERNASDDSEESDSNSSHTINLNNISMTESIYFSMHEPGKSVEESERDEPTIQKSNFAIEILIKKGTLGLCVPIRDKESQILSEDMGKIDFELNELKIFSVNGYNDNKNLCYLCLQLGELQMDHCGRYARGSPTGGEGQMLHTLYKTPQGHTKSNQPKMKEREMLSLVIETKRVPDQRIKRLRVATGIQQTTLRYYTMLANQFWLHQLIDFLDVVDYPIAGYVPFGIITEMQLHLWNCAIDYRPKNFDYRALVELGAFTVSSNVISAAAGCNLRFIVEEFILSLAPYDETKEQHKILIDAKYLVPILDIGFFDISLRLNENARDRYPKFDLRCSVHDAHLRTCSDSGKALAQLIEHLANDGDSVEADANIISTTTQSSECDNSSDTSSVVDEERRRRESITQQQLELRQERVNLMMAEALRDTVTISAAPTTAKQTTFNAIYGIEPYYFPDEQQACEGDDDNDLEERNELAEIMNFEQHVMSQSYTAVEPSEDVLPQVKSDLGDVNMDVRYQAQQQQQQQRRSKVHEDEYCVISEDERQILMQCGVQDLKICDDPLRIVDNHFNLPTNKVDLLKAPADFPTPVSRYTLCEMTITWHLYGGRDFLASTEDVSAKTEASHLRMSDAYKHGVSYSKGDNTVHAGKKPRDISWKSIGGVQRNHEVIVEIQLTKARLSHEIYPSNTTQASRQVLVINDIEIRDRLQSSEINKFLYHPRTQTHKSPQQMLVIKALHIRPQPKLSMSEECSLRISLLPMRLHIDQDTLIFLADFFANIGNNMKEAQSITTSTTDNNPLSQPEPHAPIMEVAGETSELDDELQARELISTNLDLLESEVSNKVFEQSTETKEKSAPIYFREVQFSPDVPIRFDYHGRRVELSRGPIAGLVMGLGQLQCSEIRLKKIIHRRGFLGIDKLMTYLFKEWLKDIKRNQLPKILKGVGPTYSFVQFVQGVIDLFRLPIEQYQRDGRIIRGLQLGAQSFTARTALAALEITSRFIQLLQFTAETAFDLVSSGPSIARARRKHRKDKRRRAQRPKDMREGVTNAYLIVKEGINDSAATLIETAVAEHDQKGYTGAVGAVMRQIPQLVVCPAVLATQATTNILGGVKSSLVPEAKVEARDKWKTDND